MKKLIPLLFVTALLNANIATTRPLLIMIQSHDSQLLQLLMVVLKQVISLDGHLQEKQKILFLLVS